MKKTPRRQTVSKPHVHSPRVLDNHGKELKIFVLDTNVPMHDPTCAFRFEEHDVYVPMVTLEELDNNKKGQTEVARNARQFTRTLDSIMQSNNNGIDKGISLYEVSNKAASGSLFFQTDGINLELPRSLPMSKADNEILAVVIHLQQKYHDRKVILVSKDINMRIKARALGLSAQDYFNDKVLEDSDLLYSGSLLLPLNFWETHGEQMSVKQNASKCLYYVSGPLCSSMLVNQYVYMEDTEPFSAIVKEVKGKTAVLETMMDYTNEKNAVWGIKARNREQNFALNLLLDPEIDFITLLGQAGTGKTLLTLAAGLTQVIEKNLYSEIIMTRVTVPVGEDIGFLPGTEEEKMHPWMGALDDNLDVLCSSSEKLIKDDGRAGVTKLGTEWAQATNREVMRTRIKVKSLNFMRGRTFLGKFLIIDEAQNLTPKQMKTLITRAGPGTKVVCLGNIAQIDTPYLSEGASGLTYVVDRFKGWVHGGHITLQRGERSRLADYAGEVL